MQQFEDPNSATFHQTLASSEYTARFCPTEEAYNAVLSYLKENGLSLVLGSKNRRINTVQGTRAQAQKAFHVSINDYQLGSRSFHAIASDPALPANIAPFLVSVFGLSNLGQMHPASTPQPLTPMAASFARPRTNHQTSASCTQVAAETQTILDRGWLCSARISASLSCRIARRCQPPIGTCCLPASLQRRPSRGFC
jgi:kumamolisin